jgi:hypothetical protein
LGERVVPSALATPQEGRDDATEAISRRRLIRVPREAAHACARDHHIEIKTKSRLR